MRKILVPIDFSNESLNALEYAAGVARTCGMKIMLTHIVENTEIGSSGTMGASNDTSMAQLYMLKYLQKLKKDINDLEKKYHDCVFGNEVVIKNGHNKIAPNIASQEADMIIMGTKGSSGIKEYITSTNTGSVVQRAKCPVLSVKPDNKFKGISNIVFASDFKENIPRITGFVKNLARQNKAAIHLLSINSPRFWERTKVSRKNISRFVEKYGIADFTINIYNHNTEEEGIAEFAQEVNADFIALMTNGKKGFERLFMPGISEKLVNRAPLPVLTLNKKIEKLIGSPIQMKQEEYKKEIVPENIRKRA